MFKNCIQKISLLFFAVFLFGGAPLASAETTIPVEYFGRDDCAHCQDLKDFLEVYEEENTSIRIREYDVKTEKGKAAFDVVTTREGFTKTTPLLLVGDRWIQGFVNEKTTGVRIKEIIGKVQNNKTMTIEEYIKEGKQVQFESNAEGVCTEDSCVVPTNEVDLPFFGTVDLKEFSLPVMAVFLGFVDGFNPCAMWVLIMFLIALMQLGDRKKMWQVAGLFIVAEAIMYTLILNVWMTTWDFVGLDAIVTPLVGLVAVGGGIFFLWEWKTSDGTCKVTSPEQQRKTHQKITEIVQKPMTWAVGLSILGLALSVNVIEFACSIGIPQAFTKILDMNMLLWIERQWYVLLYILFYMVDDVIVFGVALYSFEKIASTYKYTRWANFIGGIIMLMIGVVMLTNPSLLVF